MYLNGTLINDFTNTDPNRNLDGYIGIQNHGGTDDGRVPQHPDQGVGHHPADRCRPGQGPGGQVPGRARRELGERHPDPAVLVPGQRGADLDARSGQTLQALGKCLDVSGGGTANGTKVQLWACNGGGNQNWAAQSDGTLRNPQSGKCLDVSGNNSADGTVVHLWTCIAGAANQKWTLP